MSKDMSFEDAFTQQVLGDLDQMADAVAQRLGVGGNIQRYSDAEQATMWNSSPIADPEQRAQTMMQMFQQGMSVEDITDQVYPQRRKLIATGRPKLADQIQYAQQMDRMMARQARDQGIHFPHDETWARITEPNAPTETQANGGPPAIPSSPENAVPAPAPGVPPPPPSAPTMPPPGGQAPTAPVMPGWAQGPGGLFS